MVDYAAVSCLSQFYLVVPRDSWQHRNTASWQLGQRDNSVKNVGWNQTKIDTRQQTSDEETWRSVSCYAWKNEDAWQQDRSDTCMRWKGSDWTERSKIFSFGHRKKERKVGSIQARICGTSVEYSIGFCETRRECRLGDKDRCKRSGFHANFSNNLSILSGCRIRKGHVKAGNGEQADDTEKNIIKLVERERESSQNGKVFERKEGEILKNNANNGQNRGFRLSEFDEEESEQSLTKYNAAEETVTTIEIFEKVLDKKDEKDIEIKEKKDAGVIGVPLGRALLLGVTILWGVYGVTLRYIYSQPGPPLPSALTFVRKALSVSFFLVLLPFEGRAVDAISNTKESANSRKPIESSEHSSEVWWDWLLDPKIWRAGAELGIWSFIGASLQTSALEYTTATRAGFEVQITNILVPMLAFFFGEKVNFSTWAAALLALGGIVLLGISANVETVAELSTSPDMCTGLFCPPEGVLLGDLGVISAAFFFALTTVRLGVFSREVPAVRLTTVNMTVALLLSAGWTGRDLWEMAQRGVPLSTAWESWTDVSVLLVVTFSAIGCGAVAALVQTFGQSVVPTAEAQVLYSLTPVWSSLFAASLLDERISPLGYLGGGIVLLATLLATRKGKDENNEN